MYIEQLLNKYCKTFRGVFSADNLDKQLKKIDVFCIVCNLSNSDAPGSHFITIIAKKDHVSYIDSLGDVCYIPSILSFLNSLKKPIMFNSKKVQHPSSIMCGVFCIMYCLYFDREQTFVLTFSNDLAKNDKICSRYVVGLIGNLQ